ARAPVRADDDGGHTLADDRLGARILGEITVAVRVDVDEARRYREPSCVDLLATGWRQPRPDVSDAPGRNRDIELAALHTGSVKHRAATNNQIIINAARHHL